MAKKTLIVFSGAKKYEEELVSPDNTLCRLKGPSNQLSGKYLIALYPM
jgi:hypothetical protein